MAIITYKKPKIKKAASDDLPILLSNRLYVPTKLVTNKMMDKFTYEIGNKCKDCNCDAPLECPNADIAQVESFKEFRDGDYIGFNRGNIGKLKKVFADYWDQVVDERSRVKMKYKISFIGTLRPKQKKTFAKWMKKKYGSIKAPPRSGKTVLIAALTCELGYQTLILVHQDELAEQFYKTFMNLNEDADGNKIIFTDAPYLEKKYKKTMVGIARTLHDLEQGWPVTICTYQKFLKHGKTLKRLRDIWGAMFCDEYHMASALRFSQICSTINSKVRIGVSATPERKDNYHHIGYDILGPPKVIGFSDQMVCKVKWIYSDHEVAPFKQFHIFIKRLCEDKKRNQLIIDNVIKDLDNGRHIMITCIRTKHAKDLTRMLQREGYKAETLVGNTPNRKQILEDFKKGKIDALFASRKITQVGLDIPIMDCIYLPVPNFNKYNLEQEVARCRTPYEGKPQPLVRVVVDRGGSISHAAKNAFYTVFAALGFEFEGGAAEYSKTKKKKGWM